MGVLLSVPGQTMGVSVFTDSLIQALGLDRVRISTAYMVGTMLSALLMTKAGKLYDAFGVRKTSGTALVSLAFFLFLLSASGKISTFLVSLVPGAHAVVPFVMAVIGFLGIRFFGQGVLTLVSRSMVMQWFRDYRGLAAAILGIVTSFGFSLAPRVLQTFIDGYGWRGALITIAGVLVLGGLPFVLILFRDHPEACGMSVEEGLKPRKINRRRKMAEPEHDATLKEAQRDPRYWTYILFLSWWSMFNTAFTFHIISIFASRGVPASQAVAIFLPISVLSVFFNFLGSWASDLIDLALLYFVTVSGMILASIGMVFPGTPWAPFILIIGFGMTNGLWSVLNTVTMPKLYGRTHLGAVSGFVMSFLVAGSALGPWLFSLVQRRSGGYVGAGILGIIGPIFLIILGIVSFSRSRGIDSRRV